MSNCYEKMDDYINSIYTIFKIIYDKANKQHDERLQMISLTIYNYAIFMAKEYNIDFNNIKNDEVINLIPIFEYITFNNIKLYDFSSISIDDLDVTKKEDLEKFVLTHIYYITQGI
jgi:hypothetical protein